MYISVEPDDKVITAYRCHPFAVLRGGTIKGVIAELLGQIILLCLIDTSQMSRRGVVAEIDFWMWYI